MVVWQSVLPPLNLVPQVIAHRKKALAHLQQFPLMMVSLRYPHFAPARLKEFLVGSKSLKSACPQSKVDPLLREA